MRIDRPSTLSDPSWLWADACLRDPELFDRPRGRKRPSWLPREAPRAPNFYYRGPRSKLLPIGEPGGLWLPLSCAFSLVNNVSASLGINGGASGAIDTTGANLIVISTAFYTPGGSPLISDSNGNIYTTLEDRQTGVIGCLLAYTLNPSVGSGHTFSASGITVYNSIQVTAWSGAKTTLVVDQHTGATGTSTATLNTGSITPTEDNELLTAAVGYEDNSGGSVSIGGGFTIQEANAYSAGVSEGGAQAFLIQTSAAAANPQWNVTNAPSVIAACIASFKAAAGGGGGNPWYARAQQ